MDLDEEYVRRRRWGDEEKRAIIEEAAASGNVTGTAKRHGIQAQQIYRWRERLFGPNKPVGFVPVSIAADPSLGLPAPVLDHDCPAEAPAPVLDGTDDRIEIVAGGGVTVRLPPGSAVPLIVAVATGLARRRP